MATTKQEIRGWLEEGQEKGATHVIVMCDTFDYSDYPEYVMPGESIFKKVEEFRERNMQRVEEVYNLNLDIEEQLNEKRAFH